MKNLATTIKTLLLATVLATSLTSCTENELPIEKETQPTIEERKYDDNSWTVEFLSEGSVIFIESQEFYDDSVMTIENMFKVESTTKENRFTNTHIASDLFYVTLYNYGNTSVKVRVTFTETNDDGESIKIIDAERTIEANSLMDFQYNWRNTEAYVGPMTDGDVEYFYNKYVKDNI